jgi:hypothetical protein
MSIPGSNYYSQAEREEIIGEWSYDKVVAEAEKTVGRATCDRSIFLRRASLYKGMGIELEHWLQEGRFNYEKPFGSGTYTRSGMSDYRLRKNVLENMRKELILGGSV